MSGRATSPKKKRKRSPSPLPRRGDDTRTTKRERSDSDTSPDRTPPRRTTTTTQNRGRSTSYSRTPPTRQVQRQYTRTVPRGVGPQRGYSPPPRRPVPRWPEVGVGEVTTADQRLGVRVSRDLGKLWDLWKDLVRNEPHRTGLIDTVERQIIRTELDHMMGGPNATRANLQIDGRPKAITEYRDSQTDRTPDERRTDGSDRARTVWNQSLRDTEVSTIRDIKDWASGLTRDELDGAQEITVQLVGTSGPCEACKDRVRFMAQDIVDEWHDRTGLPLDRLPEVRVMSYYGNPPEPRYTRGGYTDVRNGWVGDPTPGDLGFVNKLNWNQDVREHEVIRVNRK
jgi:hypothetical protein